MVDENQAPISGIRITEMWNNYSFHLFGGADVYTDADGVANFPKAERTAPVFYWVLRAIWTKVDQGVHASSGTIATINISDLKVAKSVGANCVDWMCTEGTIKSQLNASLR